MLAVLRAGYWRSVLLNCYIIEQVLCWLYCVQATGDPYYLDVGKSVVDNLDRLARVPCGFAAIKDVTSGTHEDQYVMDAVCLSVWYLYKG